jgi:hypothetical protein
MIRVLQRKPYVIAVVAAVLFLVVWNAGRQVFDSKGERGWLDWVVVGFIAYAVVGLVVLIPRSMAPRMVQRRRGETLAATRLAFALSPFLIALGAWGSGADEWSATVALGAAVVLLLLGARATATRRDESA